LCIVCWCGNRLLSEGSVGAPFRVSPPAPLASPLPHSPQMVGKAISKDKRARDAKAVRIRLYEVAVETYHAEQKKPPTERKGARAVCDEVTRAHCRSTGMDVPLSHSTLLRLAAG